MCIDNIELKLKELLKLRNNPNTEYFEQINDLMQSIDENIFPLIKIKLLLLKSMGLMVLASYNEVDVCYDQIESIRINHPDIHEVQALAFRSLGTYKWNNSNFEHALSLFSKALVFEKDDINIVFLKQKIGMSYFKLNDYEKTFLYFNEAYKGKDLINDLIAKADIISWFAIIHNEIGMYEKSQQLAQEALEINLNISNYIGLATNYNTIGLSNKSAGYNEQALNFFFEAEKYAQKASSFIHLANTCNNIASIYQYQANKENAIAYFEKSLDYRQKTLQFDLLSVTLKNLVNLYLEVNTPQKTKILIDQIETLYHNNPIPKIKIMLLFAKSFLANYEQDYLKAIEYLNENLVISDEIAYTINKLAIYDHLSVYYENLHDYKKALDYQKLLKQVMQEINYEEEKKSIKNLNIIHQQVTDQFMIDKKIQEEKIKTIIAMSITISHEINQPLMQIQGNLDMLTNLLQTQDNPIIYQKYCTKILDGIQKITNLTEKFLNHTSVSFTDYLQDEEMLEFN